MPTTKAPAPESREERLTRWAFNFFMAGVGLTLLLVIFYLITLY